MTTSEWLKVATRFLQSKSIATARLDCLVLLEDTLRTSRAQLLAEPQTALTDAAVKHLQKLLSRRAHHEPLAYIRGKTEFYGRTFRVTQAVLEPRPESETMLDMLKEICVFNGQTSPLEPQNSTPTAASPAHAPISKNSPPNLVFDRKKPRIADVGAGSGALGITAALEVPGASVDLLEVDPAALEVAKTNVDLFTINVSVIESDLLTQSPKNYDILLCNLPYVPEGHTINRAALHEPRLAIFGGPDGLDVYRRLFAQAQECPRQPLYILSEALPPQHEALAAIAAGHGYQLQKTDDFIQLFACL